MEDAGDDASIALAAHWLRLMCHVLTCNAECGLRERCATGKASLAHMLHCSSAACTFPGCASLRRLALHWLECQDDCCRLCSAVAKDLREAPAAAEAESRARAATRTAMAPRAASPASPDAPQRALSSSLATGHGPHSSSSSPAAAEVDPERRTQALQEASAYLRYLMFCFMRCTPTASEAASAGVQFWVNALTVEPPGDITRQPPSPCQEQQQEPMRMSAGRRLLLHRLACLNPGCVLCREQCELFTRGNGLQLKMRAPRTVEAMDDIVQELSLALGGISL